MKNQQDTVIAGRAHGASGAAGALATILAGAPAATIRAASGGGDFTTSEELRLVLLSLIAEQPRHGYDLIREIEERTAGGYAPSPGIVYPTLTMLQDMGLIAEEGAAGTRKVYAATPEGKALLAEKKEEVAALLARITELKSAQRGDRAPVRRALRNLYAALSEKVSRSDNDELMHKIAALLDEVTQKIEKS